MISRKEKNPIDKIPLVAVIVPCYNLGKYLGECLDSVLAQTVKDWVCIVVDDGSIDNTAEIAKEYCLKSDKIFYHYQKNSGVSAARNKGIAITSSHYILPLDADDYLAPDYLEVTSSILNNNPEVKLAYTDCQLFGAENRLWLLPKYDAKQILILNQINVTALYRRVDYEKTEGYDPNLTAREDWDFWLSLLDHESVVVKHPEPLFFYRQRAESVNHSVSWQKNQEIREYVYKKHQEKFQVYPEFSTVNDYLKFHNERRRKIKAKQRKVKFTAFIQRLLGKRD